MIEVNEFQNTNILTNAELKILYKLSNSKEQATKFISLESHKESLDKEVGGYFLRNNKANSSHEMYKLYVKICQNGGIQQDQILTLEQLKEKAQQVKTETKEKKSIEFEFIGKEDLPKETNKPLNNGKKENKKQNNGKKENTNTVPKTEPEKTQTKQDDGIQNQVTYRPLETSFDKSSYPDINFSSAMQVIENYYKNNTNRISLSNNKDLWKNNGYKPDGYFGSDEIKQLQELESKYKKGIIDKPVEEKNNSEDNKNKQGDLTETEIPAIDNPQELFIDNAKGEKTLGELSFEEAKNLAYTVFGSGPGTELMIKLSEGSSIFITRIIALGRHEGGLEFGRRNRDPNRRSRQYNIGTFQISSRNVDSKYDEMLNKGESLCKQFGIGVDMNNLTDAQKDLISWFGYVQTRNEFESKNYFGLLQDEKSDTKKLMPKIQKGIKAIGKGVDRQLNNTSVALNQIESHIGEKGAPNRFEGAINTGQEKEQLISNNAVIFGDSWVEGRKGKGNGGENAFGFPGKGSKEIASNFFEYTKGKELKGKTLIIQAGINNAGNSDVLTHIDKMIDMANNNGMKVVVCNYSTDHKAAKVINEKLEIYRNDPRVNFVDLYNIIPGKTTDLHPYDKYGNIIANLEKVVNGNNLIADSTRKK